MIAYMDTEDTNYRFVKKASVTINRYTMKAVAISKLRNLFRSPEENFASTLGIHFLFVDLPSKKIVKK